MIDTLLQGLAAHDTGITINRVAVGVFFAISGFHKLFNHDRHTALVETLKRDHIPFVRFNAWFVPSVELYAGALLAIGLFSVLSALLLGAVCLVATCADGLRRVVEEFKPIDKADFVDDLLYLPEVLYGLMLVAVICSGPGVYSVDYLLWR